MRIDEQDLYAAYEQQRHRTRDAERELVVRRTRKHRKPRYSRFETLARITDNMARNWPAKQAPLAARKEAA